LAIVRKKENAQGEKSNRQRREGKKKGRGRLLQVIGLFWGGACRRRVFERGRGKKSECPDLHTWDLSDAKGEGPTPVPEASQKEARSKGGRPGGQKKGVGVQRSFPFLLGGTESGRLTSGNRRNKKKRKEGKKEEKMGGKKNSGPTQKKTGKKKKNATNKKKKQRFTHNFLGGVGGGETDAEKCGGIKS